MAIHIRRREFIFTLGGAAAAWALAARAQQADRMRRVGVLVSGTTANDPELPDRIAAFLQGMQQLGWTDGRNIRIDIREVGANRDLIRKHAAELVALAPDVIFSTGAAILERVLQATPSAPTAGNGSPGAGPRWLSSSNPGSRVLPVCQQLQTSLGFGRAKAHGLLVPETRLHNVRIDPHGTDPGKHGRVVGCAQSDRRRCVIGFRGPLEDCPGGSKVAGLGQLLALFHKERDGLAIKGSNHRLRRQRPDAGILRLRHR
jgi:hypothetical protein